MLLAEWVVDSRVDRRVSTDTTRLNSFLNFNYALNASYGNVSIAQSNETILQTQNASIDGTNFVFEARRYG